MIFKFLILIIICLISPACSELFTAVVHLEKLLMTEQHIVGVLDAYLASEEERLNKLKEIKKKYQAIERFATSDSDHYLNNPINSYLLIKSLTTDWKTVENLMKNGSAETASALLYKLYNNEETFPSTEDLNGVADALLRLQDTYKLETSNLANGDIPINLLHRNDRTESKSSKSNEIDHYVNKLTLTSGDCFELGKYTFSNEDYYHAVLWMQQALEQHSKEVFKQSNVLEILEYLAFANYQQNNLKEALKYTNMLLAEQPNHSRAARNKKYYEAELSTLAVLVRKLGDDGSENMPTDPLNSETLTPKKEKESSEHELYESLCRGDDHVPQRIKNTLYCHYLDTRNTPYLRLSRIKMEIVYHKPHAVIYHDVVSDNEIETIKRLATPKLKRATVQNASGDLVTATYRISKSAWLTNEEDEAINRISKRIELITNLTTKTAEELQVVNYGIGGHYEVTILMKCV